jgi:hypothetical protein
MLKYNDLMQQQTEKIANNKNQHYLDILMESRSQTLLAHTYNPSNLGN